MDGHLPAAASMGSATPIASGPGLRVLMYHYVRPPSNGLRLKGLTPDQFDAQLAALQATHEMATVESALAFLRGSYTPRRPLCLLTFDDGLIDHYRWVFPILVDRRVQGVFFLATACQSGRMAAVHKNHLLLGTLRFDEYRRRCLDRLAALAPHAPLTVDMAAVRRTYRWDDEETAALKYLLNFQLPQDVTAAAIDGIFGACFGDEAEAAREFYLTWAQARVMQRNGMVMGGHSHRHLALANMEPGAQRDDIARCAGLLEASLHPQEVWPFSYPYGRQTSFTPDTVNLVRHAFGCAFCTERGDNTPGTPLFAIHRLDPKDVCSGLAAS